MNNKLTRILEGIQDMMDQAHKEATTSKTTHFKVVAQGRFMALCEVQDMIREIMEDTEQPDVADAICLPDDETLIVDTDLMDKINRVLAKHGVFGSGSVLQLRRENKRYIDADKLPRHGNRGGVVYWRDIEKQPPADVIEVVRCRECRYLDKG